MSNQAPIQYIVDPSTNPSRWPGSDPDTFVSVWRVDVIYINLNEDSNFRIARTGTNENINQVVIQVTKHVARGLYDIVSMNVSEFSCVVVMSTEKSTDELSFRNGFPWDRPDDPQPAVVLE
ncbi:hypothetical protein FLONG3_1086 [Fusarium longipes]|uniref:Uncharacterized protein n=1 Tax=Fusarium longipes TaxID=694270 RepID=A0A395T8H6_9HYPO|nr:hypothetical protein FLONG3_1086 [Fusarium longipes]